MTDECIEMEIPLSLRPIAPFLEEAQSILREQLDERRGHVAVCCIDHAFDLMDRFQLSLGCSGRKPIMRSKSTLPPIFPLTSFSAPSSVSTSYFHNLIHCSLFSIEPYTTSPNTYFNLFYLNMMALSTKHFILYTRMLHILISLLFRCYFHCRR